jgi:hypothetical protein
VAGYTGQRRAVLSATPPVPCERSRPTHLRGARGRTCAPNRRPLRPQGAATSVFLAACLEVDAVTGCYYQDCTEAPVIDKRSGHTVGVAPYAVDHANADRLWHLPRTHSITLRTLDDCLLHRENIVDWAETRPLRTGLTTGPRASRYPRRHRRTINGVLHDIDCRQCVRNHCKQDNSPRRVSSTTAGTASRIGNAAPTSGPATADSGRKGGLPGICDQPVIATHGH